ncbi:hypothetical protein HK101_011238 [Irineochytrium annulatum]|nr:hypothetical protein HK101_011238 [Irineochytrium annulatum]
MDSATTTVVLDASAVELLVIIAIYFVADNGRDSLYAAANEVKPQEVEADNRRFSRVVPKEYKQQVLVRDFIHDSLYNANHGYFSKKAKIFSPPKIDFNSIRDNYTFMNHLADLYSNAQGAADDSMRQVWHTPSELFKPWYGRAIAKYVCEAYRKNDRGATNLLIFEVGGGNGTLMGDILDFIAERHPEIYKKTLYTVIEISPALALRQSSNNRHKCVRIVNQSIFEWQEKVPDPCFLLAMEVIDNFPHDLVRYDLKTGTPVQGVVTTEKDGDYTEEFQRLSDPLIARFLEIRSRCGVESEALRYPFLRKLRQSLPFAPNLTDKEFLPTMAMRFLEQLHTCFPNHRLILSDFDSLPDAIPGLSAPVVQTSRGGLTSSFPRTFLFCAGYIWRFVDPKTLEI